MAVVDGKIRCPECQDEKLLAEFDPRDAARGNGYCRPCKRARKAAWQLANRQADAARRRERYLLSKTAEGREELEGRRRSRASGVVPSLTPEYSLRYRLASRYGMTELDYQRILREQGGVCGCCGTPRNIDGRMWCVDHDHSTGEVRGLLCTKCNAGIGNLGDDLPGIRRALAYLEKHERGAGPPRMKINLMKESHHVAA